MFDLYRCRNESDYLYKDELNGYLATGTLTNLRVAMSRGIELYVCSYIYMYVCMTVGIIGLCYVGSGRK